VWHLKIFHDIYKEKRIKMEFICERNAAEQYRTGSGHQQKLARAWAGILATDLAF